MGISGGLDSSYLAYLGSKWGLRILGVHVDDGFDTEISKNNIQKLCKAAKIDLVTITPDAEQYNDLTRAYMLAGVPNLATPQDNVLFACLYSYMREHQIKYFLTGANYALESILQRGNTYTPYDTVNIRAIHRRFGRKSIRKLKLISRYRLILEKKLLGVQTAAPLMNGMTLVLSANYDDIRQIRYDIALQILFIVPWVFLVRKTYIRLYPPRQMMVISCSPAVRYKPMPLEYMPALPISRQEVVS